MKLCYKIYVMCIKQLHTINVGYRLWKWFWIELNYNHTVLNVSNIFMNDDSYFLGTFREIMEKSNFFFKTSIFWKHYNEILL